MLDCRREGGPEEDKHPMLTSEDTISIGRIGGVFCGRPKPTLDTSASLMMMMMMRRRRRRSS
jgi:hypothetical protein